MESEHLQLWKKIEAFQVTPTDVSLPFCDRLARENGWSRTYAERVIVEYKRFIFLAVTAGHPVTPSDQVDQAWHLHLAYTESYWRRLCGEVLQLPLHHGPTEGGRAEGTKFRDWYAKTLESYEFAFGVSPPPDIWPHVRTRFRNVENFRRIDTSQFLLVPKIQLSSVSAAAISAAVFGCAAVTSQNSADVKTVVGVGAFVVILIAIFRGAQRGPKPRDRNHSRSSWWGGCGGTGGCGADGCGGGGCGGCGG